MKRLISILVIVAMMLASVLAMIPAFAAEGEGAGAGDATVTEPKKTYNVNWKELVEGGHMRSQWLYERHSAQNNMAAKYNITATDTALSLDRDNGKSGDHRQYYSDIMFDITADTQYVYELEVKSVSPEGDGGFIFAFANNPKARDEDDGKRDIDGNKVSDKVAAYFLNGKLNTGSAGIYFGGAWGNYGYEDGKAYEQNIVDAEVSEDGYTKYKIVYTGLNAEFFYFDKNGAWVELYADKTITLAEGAKLTAGIYAWNMDWADIKNCVVYAMNDAAATAMEAALSADKTAFDAKLAEAELFVETDWLSKDWANFVAAIDFAKASVEGAQYKYVYDYNIARIDLAISKLSVTANNIKPTLEAKITAADALAESQALYTETTWAKMAAALVDAKAVIADEASTQGAMVAAYNLLNDTMKGLLTKELAAKNVYAPNWKLFVENNAMRSQWLYNRAPSQNNMADKYNIVATDTALSINRDGGKGGDHRQYYSEVMLDITDYTYYVYELEVKSVSPEGDGGFIFAFANNPKGRDEDDEKRDVDGNGTSNKVSAYLINGKLNDGSAGLYFGGAWDNYGYEDQKNLEENLVNAKVSDDGYTKYKIVYDGYVVEVFYLDANDAWVELYANETITLAQGAKVACGIYAWNMDWADIRNCVVTAYNDAATEILFNTVTAYLYELADAKLAGTYTPATEKAVSDAMAAVKAITAETTYADANDKINALVTAILNLKMADKTALNTAIDAANAAIDGKTAADFEAKYYDPFKAALDAAIVERDDVNATQEEVDAALEALNNTFKYLTPAGEACKVDLVDVLAKYAALVETDYKPSSWATLATPFATAKGLNENAELTNADQDAIDAAVVALNEAITALVKRGNYNKLNAAIERADGLDKSDYTVDSWNVDDVLAAAKAAAANFELDQAEIDKALADLNAAVNALVTWRSDVLAIVPGDDYQVNDTEKYPNPNWYNKITDMSYFGLGNVFYYDYYKVIAAKASDWADKGFEIGKPFPDSLEKMDFQGNANYVLRLGTNMSGSGTNRVTDGDNLGTAASHRADPTVINGKVHNHVFGFSFIKAPTVDSIAVYLPTDTKIVSIDVYGAVRTTAADGTVIYGKADKDAVVTDDNGVRDESATTVAKLYLGTVEIPAAAAGAENIYAAADFLQAMKVDYIYFGINCAEGTGKNAYYGIYEIDLFGLNDGETVDGKAAPNFTAVNAAYAAFTACVESDYTEESWNNVLAVLAEYGAVINNLKADQANVDAAAAALDAAVKALVAKPADWTQLDAAISAGAPILEKDYTPLTYGPFKAAYDAAVALRAGTNIPQTKVDAAAALLNDVFAKLAKRPDKTQLNAAIEEAKTLVKDAWDANLIAWNMFENALNDAIALFANDNTTQEEVNTVLEQLQARRAELKADASYVPPVVDDPNKETDPPAGNETNAPAGNETNDAATDAPAGDETDAPAGGCGGCGSSAALSALAVVAVIGTAVVLKKKED